MRVGIDMYYTQTPLAVAGIGNFSFEYVTHLAEHPDVELFLFHPKYDGMTLRRYQKKLSRFILDNKLDIFHLTSTVPFPQAFTSGHLPPIRLVATVYDVIPVRYPDIYLPTKESKRDYNRYLEMLHRAHRLLAISEHTRTDFIDIGFDINQVVHIGTGGNQFFYPLADASLNDLKKHFPTNEPFMLAVSPIDFRKNAERLVEAFCISLRNVKKDFHLVFVGDAPKELQDRLRRIARKHGRPGFIHFAGRVTKSQLLRLYNRALALLMPSLYEGWGLPVLEAMQCGTPVLTSNTTSLPEVAGEAAVYVDPTDVHSIVSGIHRILMEPGLRNQLKNLGLARAKGLSWRNVINKTVNEYQRLMNEVAVSPNTRIVRVKSHVRLKPKRYKSVRAIGSKSHVAYVSYDFHSIPRDAEIRRAILHIPVKRHTGGFRIHKITSRWNKHSIHRTRPPIRRSTSCKFLNRSTRPTGEFVFKFNCTTIARRWNRHPQRNYGLFLGKSLSRQPSLMITYYRNVVVHD